MPLTSASALPGVTDLEDVAPGRYHGSTPDVVRPRVFGGHLVAQALLAAGRDVPRDRPPHSLHAYFLRAVVGNAHIEYEVGDLRESRSFSTRSVTARQAGRPVFTLVASFHAQEDGPDHQLPPPRPAAAPPTDLLEIGDADDGSDLRRERWRRLFPGWEMHQLPPAGRDPADLGRTRVWMRARSPLPQEPLMHSVALAYASDMTLIETAVRAHGLPYVRHGLALVSLDHSMWFHRPCRVDEWLLIETTSPSAAGGRGLAVGHIFSAEGVLVATVSQEGLMRPPIG